MIAPTALEVLRGGIQRKLRCAWFRFLGLCIWALDKADEQRADQDIGPQP